MAEIDDILSKNDDFCLNSAKIDDISKNNLCTQPLILFQHTVDEEEELSTELRDLSQDPIMNEVLSKNGGSSPSGDSWGSMGSVLGGSKSQESIPLYKRRAGAGGGPNEMMMMASSPISPISFPDNSEHVSREHRFDMSMLNVIDEGMMGM